MNKRHAIVTRALTGHTHYRSPYECYDKCGTCDGARCDYCREKWEVTYFGPDNKDNEIFNTKEEAIAAQEEYEKGKEVEMSNRNSNLNSTGTIDDVVVDRNGHAQPVEGEQPLPSAEPPRGGFIRNFLNYNFTVGGVVKGILALTAVGVAYGYGKKKGVNRLRSSVSTRSTSN